MDGQFLEHLGESLKDRLLFQGAHKLFGMLIDIVALEFASDYRGALGEAVAYVMSGIYSNMF